MSSYKDVFGDSSPWDCFKDLEGGVITILLAEKRLKMDEYIKYLTKQVSFEEICESLSLSTGDIKKLKDSYSNLVKNIKISFV